MYFKRECSFSYLKDNCWSGAIYTLNIIEALNNQEELMNLLEEVFYETIPTLTEINDFLWFDTDFIFESLGIEEGDNCAN